MSARFTLTESGVKRISTFNSQSSLCPGLPDSAAVSPLVTLEVPAAGSQAANLAQACAHNPSVPVGAVSPKQVHTGGD